MRKNGLCAFPYAFITYVVKKLMTSPSDRSDSYAWQIDYLIASSFNKTYVVNLRYDKWKKEDLNLEEYMKERNIKKVLFLYEGGSMMFDQYNYNLEGRIK